MAASGFGVSVFVSVSVACLAFEGSLTSGLGGRTGLGSGVSALVGSEATLAGFWGGLDSVGSGVGFLGFSEGFFDF